MSEPNEDAFAEAIGNLVRHIVASPEAPAIFEQLQKASAALNAGHLDSPEVERLQQQLTSNAGAQLQLAAHAVSSSSGTAMLTLEAGVSRAAQAAGTAHLSLHAGTAGRSVHHARHLTEQAGGTDSVSASVAPAVPSPPAASTPDPETTPGMLTTLATFPEVFVYVAGLLSLPAGVLPPAAVIALSYVLAKMLNDYLRNQK